jgi:hypothetical protein
MADHPIDQENARNAFAKALKMGKRDTGLLSRLAGGDNRLLTLTQVLRHVHTGGELYQGVEEIPLERIIGTENRGDEFSRGFYPRSRWMGGRWVSIYLLLSRGSLQEAISVAEVGGYFFVRDGHHRVSAAKVLGIDFIAAHVVKYPLPYHLPEGMDRNLLPLLAGKDRFHHRTGVFDILDEAEFFVACPATWKWLEREICEYNRNWFIRRYKREPENRAEQVRIWSVNLYRNAIDYIRRNSLAYLFPGKRETDIFVEMIRLWNSFEHPDEVWLGEIYALFITRQRRRRILRSAVQLFSTATIGLLTNPEEEYRRFLRMSQIEELVPHFQPLAKEKGFYRFLYRQLVHHYAPALKQRYGRAPYIQELTPRWHDDFYAPVARAARRQGGDLDQVRFYIGFSRRYLRRHLSGGLELSPALRHYADGFRVSR